MTAGEKRKRCTCDGEKKHNAERMNHDRQARLDACDQCCGKGQTSVRAPLHLATAMTLRDRFPINYIDYALYCYIQRLRLQLQLNYLSLGDCSVTDSRVMSLGFWSHIAVAVCK